MSARTSCIAIAACFVLLGCASAPGIRQQSKITCDGSAKCEVKVMVDCSSAGCQVSVDHDLVVVIDKKQLDIAWLLPNGSEYTFPENGVAFVDSKDFECKADGKLKFVCKDKHSKFGAWKYTINVTGPRTVPPLDPWVIND